MLLEISNKCNVYQFVRLLIKTFAAKLGQRFCHDFNFPIFFMAMKILIYE